MRRKVKNRHQPEPDMVYGSEEVAKFINNIMLDGKRATASRVMYKTMDIIKEKKGGDPLEVFQLALKNVGPVMEVRSRRVGGANYQVPREVRPERRQALAMRWILNEARKRSGKAMEVRLADEILAASDNEGEAVKRRENTHKMAEANKAFAHFAW